MSNLIFIRVLFVLLSVIVGYQIGDLYIDVNPAMSLIGLILGGLGATAVILLEMGLHRISVRGLSVAVFGLLLGLVMAMLVSNALNFIPMDDIIRSSLRMILLLLFNMFDCYK